MISNTYANQLLNLMFGVSAKIEGAEQVYMGLCENEPNKLTGAVDSEPSATSYKRKLIGGTKETTKYFGKIADNGVITNAAYGGVITNHSEIQFVTARQDWTEGDKKIYYWFLSNSDVKGAPAIIWGLIKDIDEQDGIEVPHDTVPTFYEGQLKASIDVQLDEN